MHELGIAVRILEIAEEAARREHANAIERIGLRVGAMSGVEPEALAFAFTAARAGTLAERAALEIEVVPLTCRCARCGLEFTVENAFGIALCPQCSEVSSDARRGSELEVSFLEVV